MEELLNKEKKLLEQLKYPFEKEVTKNLND